MRRGLTLFLFLSIGVVTSIPVTTWSQDAIRVDFLHRGEVGLALLDRRFRDVLFESFHTTSLKDPRLLSITLNESIAGFHSMGFAIGKAVLEFTFRDQPTTPESNFVKITVEIEQMPGMDGGPRFLLFLKKVQSTSGKIKDLKSLFPYSHLLPIDADVAGMLIDPEFEMLTQEALTGYYYRGGRDLAIYNIIQSTPLTADSPSRKPARYQVEVGTQGNLRPEHTLVFQLGYLPDGDPAIGRIQGFSSHTDTIEMKSGKEGDLARLLPVTTPTSMRLHAALLPEGDGTIQISAAELQMLSFRFARTLLEVISVHQEAQKSLPLNMILRLTAQLLGFSETAQAKLFADPTFRALIAPVIPPDKLGELSTVTFHALSKHITSLGSCASE